MQSQKQWTLAWANERMRCEGYPPMTIMQERVLQSLRSLFVKLQRVPSQRILLKELRQDLVFSQFNSTSFHALFSLSDDPMQAACRFAGLGEKSGCI